MRWGWDGPGAGAPRRRRHAKQHSWHLCCRASQCDALAFVTSQNHRMSTLEETSRPSSAKQRQLCISFLNTRFLQKNKTKQNKTKQKQNKKHRTSSLTRDSRSEPAGAAKGSSSSSTAPTWLPTTGSIHPPGANLVKLSPFGDIGWQALPNAGQRRRSNPFRKPIFATTSYSLVQATRTNQCFRH